MTGTFALLGMLVVPVLVALIDVAATLRARRRPAIIGPGAAYPDFEVVVPIWGDVRYLENAEYLARYGRRVVLATTTGETPEFRRALDEVADRHGFRIFRTDVPGRSPGGARSVSGRMRDQLVRDAHAVVTAEYVVCLDADTVTSRPLEQLVGEMRVRGLDIASVRLVPANSEGLLARLQAHEYRTAMLLRRLMPWLVSGACHAGRTAAHRHVMSCHSLFFQGNDVEVGLLADRLGYRVGHVLFDVPTTVPAGWRAWWRQRVAWAGGEVRLFLVNPQLAARHPFWWAYGALVAIALFPARWSGLVHPVPVLAALPLIYLVLLLHVHRGHWDRYLLLLPFYTAVTSLVITPLGLPAYLRMAWSDRNAGRIDPGPSVLPGPVLRPSAANRPPSGPGPGGLARADAPV